MIPNSCCRLLLPSLCTSAPAHTPRCLLRCLLPNDRRRLARSLSKHSLVSNASTSCSFSRQRSGFRILLHPLQCSFSLFRKCVCNGQQKEITDKFKLVMLVFIANASLKYSTLSFLHPCFY